MSSAVFSTSAAQSRPFIFDEEACVGTAALGCPVERSSTESRQHIVHSAIQNQKLPSASITPASQLAIRPAPEMAPSGIPALDALTGGLPRGCLTEIYGPASSGRTTILLAALAAATRRGEYCAVIDASDSLDPHSVAAAGVELSRLLWVRCNENSPPRHRTTKKTFFKDRSQTGCPISAAPFAAEVGISSKPITHFDQKKTHASEHRLEQVLRATDLLLESGGFGLIILDLADILPQSARRIPLTTWFRFRRAVEHKPTILLAIEQHPIAGSCSSLLLQLGAQNQRVSVDELAAKQRKNAAHGASRGLNAEVAQAPEGRKKVCMADEFPDLLHPTHAHLLTELEIHAELVRSRLDRKPASSAMFESKTAWTG